MPINKFIFLASSSYSGSTLLSFMLGSHQRIATIGELSGIVKEVDIKNYHCSCGKKINDCDFWKKACYRMKAIHKNFSLNNFGTNFTPISKRFIDRFQFSNLRNNTISDLRDNLYNLIPIYKNHYQNIVKRNIDLSNIICKVKGCNIFFDASKRPARIKYLSKYLDCEFKVIHLVKDGRGVFDSYKRYRPEISDSDAILTWKNDNKHIERSLNYINRKNQYYLRYKDLAENTENEMKNIFEFIGVEYNVEYMTFKNFEQHIIGNTKMRLCSENSIYYDEKWRDSLSLKQTKLFDRLAGKLNQKYGYY